jgi:hypothetical protein
MGLSLAVIWLAGCATGYETPSDFGSAVRGAIAQQTINPAGSSVSGVRPGMDGPSAKAAIDRYIRSFEQPLSIGNVLRIGVGEATSAGAAP